MVILNEKIVLGAKSNSKFQPSGRSSLSQAHKKAAPTGRLSYWCQQRDSSCSVSSAVTTLGNR